MLQRLKRLNNVKYMKRTGRLIIQNTNLESFFNFLLDLNTPL